MAKKPTVISTSMDERRFSKLFKAFGDPTRLRILKLLTEQELTVNEITAAVELSQPTVSRHLGILREAQVVQDRREGQRVYYSLIKQTIQNCCSGFCDCLVIDIGETKKKKD